jgi:AraC-like DNA-binding protein
MRRLNGSDAFMLRLDRGNAYKHTLKISILDPSTDPQGWSRPRMQQILPLKACYGALSNAQRSETVTEVAFRWGFNDAAHFSRRFKQAFGVTPSSVLTGRLSQRVGSCHAGSSIDDTDAMSSTAG